MFYVVKKYWDNKIMKIRLIKEFDDINEARRYCCNQTRLKFNPEKFNKEYKMLFRTSLGKYIIF